MSSGASWAPSRLAAAVENRRRELGLELVHEVCAAMDIAVPTYQRIREGRRIGPQICAKVARWTGASEAELLREQGYYPLENLSSTAAALEAKRMLDGLTHSQVARALGVTLAAYWRVIRRPRAQIQMETCGRIAKWLGCPYEQILRWERYWEEFTPLGQVQAIAMLDAGVTARKLARLSGVAEGTVNRGLRKKQRIKRDILRRWARTLDIDSGALIRALKETVSPAPRPAMLERVLHRGQQGKELLRKRGKALRKKTVAKRLSPEDLRTIKEKQRLAMHEHWAGLTSEEHLRHSIAAIHPRQLGQFGLCRVCGKLTFVEPSKLARRTGEYHGKCFRDWSAETPEWAEWLEETRLAKRTGRPISPAPQCSYGRGRRPSASDLADYFEAAVLLLRMRAGWVVRLRRRDGDDARAETVTTLAQLASALRMTKRGLYLQVERLIEYLPDPSTCEKSFARKVRTLAALWHRR
jgi:transcriptional regulator with XRE-family HTH domain